MRFRAVTLGVAAGLICGIGLAGCDNLFTQPKDKTWRPANVLPDRRMWPPKPPDHIVATTEPPSPPPAVTLALLQHGRERFDIYCAPCHSPVGDGRGMIVQRGFPAPPSFHIDRLKQAPTQHFYDVMTDGYGIMFSYADRVTPADRWAIAAYIRALQASQDTPVASLTAAERSTLQ